MFSRTVIFGFALTLMLCMTELSAEPHQEIKLELFAPLAELTFKRPLYLCQAPTEPSNYYVVEQAGRVWRIDVAPAKPKKESFIDLSNIVSTSGEEEGLLGLAFDPNYPKEPYVYVHYSAADPRRGVVARIDVKNPPASSTNLQVIFEVSQPYSNHNGGMLTFGPDGLLYLGLGDGGSASDPHNHAQNPDSMLGKIVHFDVRQLSFLKRRLTPKIFALGLRNPWRFSFDRQTGELWVADVGQYAWEEINIVKRGDNLGWRLFEGRVAFRNPDQLPAEAFVQPIHVYPHDPKEGGFSVTGGYVYHGKRHQELLGNYIFGDYVTGTVWALKRSPTTEKIPLEVKRIATLETLSSFGEDHQGELYLLSLAKGKIFLLN